jgi:hypothetical protein
MSQEGQNPEEREKELATRIQSLERQLERLSAHFGDTEPTAAPPTVTPVQKQEYPQGEISDVSEEVLNWAGRNALLPRLATLCFLLVLALILRTITDSGIINKLIGSAIGMSYATVLMIVGWYKYSKQSLLAPIFAAGGAILISTIVVETHTHFNSLPLVPAYLTLMATGIGMALISRQFKAITPISVGILGMCLAGAAIDYPRPFFPYLSLVLLTANLLSYFAALLQRCSWLRWSVLIVTMIMLQLWSVQIVTALRTGDAIPPELALSWFLPIMSVFSATYMALGMLGIVRSGRETISRFDLCLPTLNVLWAFSVMLYVARASGGGNTVVLGWVGVLIAVSHLAVSFWLAQRKGFGAPGTAAYTFACGILLAVALPAATGKWVLTLPIISLVAIFMAVMSRVWDSGTVRVATYLFQIYCCLALVFVCKGDGPAAMDAINILPAGLLACIILYQYLWCRWWPPSEDSLYFKRFDHHDRSAVLLLLSGLLCGFSTLRITLFQAMTLFPVAMHRDAFRCSLSVTINCAAIGLTLYAFLKHNKEIRNVAILVMVVGGIKVFLYDLMGTQGLPLVFSVFSFGMAAAVESIALSKWQKQPTEQSP